MEFIQLNSMESNSNIGESSTETYLHQPSQTNLTSTCNLLSPMWVKIRAKFLVEKLYAYHTFFSEYPRGLEMP